MPRNGYGMQISERILIWQERSIFGNIWQELVGFTILTSTILSLRILKRYIDISNIEMMDGQWDQTNCVSFCHQWGLISISRRKTCYSVKISISISRRSYITSFQCTLTKLRYFVDYKCGIVKNLHFRKQTMSSECRQKEHFDILFELNWNSTRCRSRRCNNDNSLNPS